MKSCILPPHPWSSSENCQCSESKHSLKCPPLHANICSSDLVWTSVRLLCVPHCDAGPPHFMDVVTYSRSHGLAVTQIFRVPGATLMGSLWLLGKGISPHIRPPRIPITLCSPSGTPTSTLSTLNCADEEAESQSGDQVHGNDLQPWWGHLPASWPLLSPPQRLLPLSARLSLRTMTENPISWIWASLLNLTVNLGNRNFIFITTQYDTALHNTAPRNNHNCHSQFMQRVYECTGTETDWAESQL